MRQILHGLETLLKWTMKLDNNVNIKIIVTLIFSYIYCWYTLQLPHRGNFNVYLQYNVFSINVFLVHAFLKQILKSSNCLSEMIM